MNLERLHEILTYRRGNGTMGEFRFIQNVLKRDFALTRMTNNTDPDKQSTFAYVLDVADANNVVPPILFCSHIDTVHRDVAGKAALDEADVHQVPLYDEGLDMYYKEDGQPLGADDGAGMWLLMEMIDAKVPGTYIFHRGEECGGIGSSGMAKDHEEWLARFKWAIAFDRRGDSDVITEMFSGKVCSQEFALGLCAALNEHGFKYIPDDTGSFTDTANYRKIIPECCNVSVGYDSEHTKDETLDVTHLRNLRDAMISIFQSGDVVLPVVRDKDAVDYARQYSYGYGFGGANDYYTPTTTTLTKMSKRQQKKLRRKLAQLQVVGGTVIESSYTSDTTDYSDWRNVPVDYEGVNGMSFYAVLQMTKTGEPSALADLIQNLCEVIEERTYEVQLLEDDFKEFDDALINSRALNAKLIDEIGQLEERLAMWESGMRIN